MRIAITGASGYTGSHLVPLLRREGHDLVDLSNSRRPPPDGVPRRPLAWDDPAVLAAGLAGCAVLVNTWWVRDPAFGMTHADAVERSGRLFAAALAAGVRRIVHVSITKPGRGAGLTYFEGKARLEAVLAALPCEVRVLRPAVLFGGDDILINNLAWALRRSPVFAVPGDGAYRLRPIHVDDFAALLATACSDPGERGLVDAVGPESFAFAELAARLAAILGLRRRIVAVPPRLAWLGAQALGRLHGDTLLTWAEVQGLMRGLLDVPGAGCGRIRLGDWAAERRHDLGRRYHSEAARRR